MKRKTYRGKHLASLGRFKFNRIEAAILEDKYYYIRVDKTARLITKLTVNLNQLKLGSSCMRPAAVYYVNWARFQRRYEMKRIMSIVLALFLIFALAACGGNGGADDPAGDQVKDPVAGAEEEPVSEDVPVSPNAGVADGEYVPEKELPKDAPVYPGAVMVDDGPYVIEGLYWRWFYETDASANEIVEYFTKEFKKMGFEIDEDLTGAEDYYFDVSTADGEAQIYHTDDEHKFSGEVTPDTPGRGYYLVIFFQGWGEE